MAEQGRRIRLAFIIANLEKGGAERVLVNLVNNLDVKKFAIGIFCLKQKGELLDFVKSSIKVYDLNCPRGYLAYFKIKKAINEFEPDILISWLGNVNAILAFFIPFLPRKVVYVCRESSIPSFFNRHYRFPFVFDFLYRFMNRYQTIICQALAMRNDLINNFNVKAEKINIIRNPVLIRNVAEGIPAEIKSFLDNSDKTLIFVGRFSKEKGIDRLLDLIKLIPTNYRMILVGYGPEEERIISEIRTYDLDNKVKIVNDCNDPSPYYKEADCIVMTSIIEGMPNVLLEAFSWGCPAVVYKTEGGVSEIITEENGLYISGNSDVNMEELMKSIIDVCESEKYNREVIIEWTRQNFGVEKIMNMYEKLFESEVRKKIGN
jgi:glycosyltransferase involved in cell wall biosynthesis